MTTMTIYDEYDRIEEKLDDYRPPHVRAADRMIQHYRDEASSPGKPPPIDPLDDIASIMRRLTWIQMTKLAEGFGVHPDVLHKWSTTKT